MKTLSIRNSMNKLAVMAAAGMLATALLLPGAVAADNDDDNDFDFATVMISEILATASEDVIRRVPTPPHSHRWSMTMLFYVGRPVRIKLRIT